MTKKAESISMSVIIIAAIALLVLVVLAVLILRAGGQVDSGTGCRGAGGDCYSERCDEIDDGSTYAANLANSGKPGKCPEERPNCCVRVSKASAAD